MGHFADDQRRGFPATDIDRPRQLGYTKVRGSRLVGQWLAFDSEPIFHWLLPMQLFTYQFLHGGVWHLLVNGLGSVFYRAGRWSQAIGRREIIGLVPGQRSEWERCFSWDLQPCFRSQFAGANGWEPVRSGVRFHGCAGSIVSAYREVYLLLFFVLPIRLKLNWVFLGFFCNCAYIPFWWLYELRRGILWLTRRT